MHLAFLRISICKRLPGFESVCGRIQTCREIIKVLVVGDDQGLLLLHNGLLELVRTATDEVQNTSASDKVLHPSSGGIMAVGDRRHI